MHYQDDVFMVQFRIAKRFVYHAVYYRTLWAAYRDNNLESEFWTHTIDAHFLQAALLWCMVFGMDGCNATHWKHLSKAQSDELIKSFRSQLPKAVGKTLSEWQQYWKEMTDFRSKYAAHRELNFNKPVPNLDSAIRAAYYYDEWVRRVIDPDTFAEPPLEETATKLTAYIQPIIKGLLEFSRLHE